MVVGGCEGVQDLGRVGRGSEGWGHRDDEGWRGVDLGLARGGGGAVREGGSRVREGGIGMNKGGESMVLVLVWVGVGGGGGGGG